MDALRCVTCGSENVAASTFCGNCGGRLSPTAASPAAPASRPNPAPVSTSPVRDQKTERPERSKLFKAFAGMLVLLGGLFTYALAWVLALGLVLLGIFLLYRFVL